MADAMNPIAHLAFGGESPGRLENSASTLGRAVAVLLLCVLWGVGASPCRAEDKPNTKVLFLVARSSILDPFFERSVVLMVPLQGEPLIVGLVVNKPTQLPLRKIFPKSPDLKNRSDNAYLGGPVDMAAPALAFHSRKPPKQAIPLYGDVYLSFDPKFIAKLIQDPKETGELRLFVGRAQWAPEQLDGEALRGSWYSIRAEGEVIFDRDTEHLWKRLESRAEAPKSVQRLLPQAPPRWEYASAPTFQESAELTVPIAWPIRSPLTSRARRLRTSVHWSGKGVQEFESCLTSLGRVSLAHPGYAGFEEAGGFGGKKEAHRLARGKGYVRLQPQAIRGEVDGSSEEFSLVTLDHKSNSHLDPLTLRRAIK